MKKLWNKCKGLLSRATWGQKSAVNFALCAFGLVILWGCMGYPLPTMEMEFRRLERTNLLPPSDIIFNSEEDSPLQWRDLPSLSFSTQRVMVGVEGDRVHVAGLRYEILETHPLGEGITPVPLYNMFAWEHWLGSSRTGVPLLFLNVPAEAERAEVEIDAVGRNGGARRGQGEGRRLAPGRWMFSVAPGEGFYGDWYAGGAYTLRLYRADGSLLLEQSGNIG